MFSSIDNMVWGRSLSQIKFYQGKPVRESITLQFIVGQTEHICDIGHSAHVHVTRQLSTTGFTHFLTRFAQYCMNSEEENLILIFFLKNEYYW